MIFLLTVAAILIIIFIWFYGLHTGGNLIYKKFKNWAYIYVFIYFCTSMYLLIKLLEFID
jgi:hypothetical protein